MITETLCRQRTSFSVQARDTSREFKLPVNPSVAYELNTPVNNNYCSFSAGENSAVEVNDRHVFSRITVLLRRNERREIRPPFVSLREVRMKLVF